MFKNLLFFILLLIFISTALATATSPQSILEKRCYICHKLDIVYKAKKSPAEWEKTIDRMIGYGARLNDEEQEAIIKYLSERK